MKYDFSTYILNKLNEAGEEKKKPIKYNTTGENKSVEITKDSTPQDVKEWIDDNFTKIKANKDGSFEFNGEQGKYKVINNNPNIKLSNLYKKVKENKNSDHTTIFKEDDFKTLGKTIAYRSALTVWSMINTSGDDFKQAAMDVFDDNSEYSIKQLENLDSLLDLSAALQTINTKLKRNDKNDKDYDKNEKIYKNYQEQLQSKDNYTAIQNIKKNYEKEFKDHRDVLEKAFNDGMAEQKKKMQEKDYKWEDPATGKEPKGAEKLNQLGDKAYKMLESGVEKASDFAKKQQGLDKALLTLAVVGVKGMIFGAKVLKNLLTGVIKRSNMHDCLRNTAKFKDVESKIKVFMKEYEEWNKENKEQSNKEDKTDEEKKQEEDKKKTILMKLSELMNTHVMPYYYAKLAIITACIENKENKYIIKQEDNKWSTYNTSTGRLTVIEDNTILMYHLLKFLTDDKQIIGFKTGFNKVLETFGDEKPDFKLPTDVNFNPTYKTNLSNWLDRATTVKDIKNPHLPFDIKQFKKNWEQFYKEELFKKSFANYKEFLEFCRKAQELLHDVHLPVAKGIKLKFKGDEDAGVPGVITGAKKEETKEEQKPEEKQNDENEYDSIVNQINKELKELKSFNELKDVANNFQKAANDIDTGYKQVKELNNKLPDTQKIELKNMFKDDITNVFGKLMYINVSKKMNGITESFSYNKMMILLLLENNGENDNYDDLLNILSNENMDSDTVKAFKEKYEQFAKEMFNWYNELKNNNKDVAAALEKVSSDPLALYLARKTIKKPKEEKKEEPQEKSGENNQ